MDSGTGLHTFSVALAWLQQPMNWLQGGLVLLALALAAWMQVQGRSRWSAGWRGEVYERVAGPLVAAIASGLAAGTLHLLGASAGLASLAALLALALLLIRSLAYALRRAFHAGPLLQASEHLISGAVWLVVALVLLGWIEPAMALLDQVALEWGDSRFSVLDFLSFLIVAAVLLIGSALLSRLLERRLMAMQEVSIGFRVGLAKVLRFALLLLACLVALNLAGINLASLAVFSGALGVGLGFGLQRIASNFISGFILVMDRSIRPGDVISIGDNFGWVQALNARYVVVRNRDGVDTLIPNENLITSEVINWSYSDSTVRLKTPVQISYGDDPEQAMALMVEVAKAHPRVQAEPAPVARLMAFGESGIDLELRIWVSDPQEGLMNIRSDLNLGIWKAFKQAGITIPFPQREVRLIKDREEGCGRPFDASAQG